MKRNVFLFWLCLSARALASDADLEIIKQELRPFQTLRGHFEQIKKIKIIKKPLKSQGDFTLVNGKGLLWFATKPIPSTLRITRAEIAQLKDGQKKVFVSLKNQPGLKVVGEILFAVFAANVPELQRYFEFVETRAKRGEAWFVTLKPKDPGVAKVIQKVEIHGAHSVDSLTLSEMNGDVTTLRFLDVVENQPLNAAEAALFE